MPETDPKEWKYGSVDAARKKKIRELESKGGMIYSVVAQQEIEQEIEANKLQDEVLLLPEHRTQVEEARKRRTIKALENKGVLIYSVEAEQEIKQAVEAQKLQNEIYLELKENREEKDRIVDLERCIQQIKNYKTIKDIQSKWTLYYEFRYFYRRYPERVKALMEPVYYEYMGEFHKTLLNFHKNLSQSNVFLSAQREEKIQDELQNCKIFGCKCIK